MCLNAEQDWGWKKDVKWKQGTSPVFSVQQIFNYVSNENNAKEVSGIYL